MVGKGQTHLLFATTFIRQRQIEENSLEESGAVGEMAVRQEDRLPFVAEPFRETVAE